MNSLFSWLIDQPLLRVASIFLNWIYRYWAIAPRRAILLVIMISGISEIVLGALLLNADEIYAKAFGFFVLLGGLSLATTSSHVFNSMPRKYDAQAYKKYLALAELRRASLYNLRMVLFFCPSSICRYYFSKYRTTE